MTQTFNLFNVELISSFFDFFLHLDDHLKVLIENYGNLTYLILFLIIFVETGLVVMPLLPGDSLLFAAGSFAAIGSFNVLYVILLLIVAAILGDTLNYWIGKTFGSKAILWKIKGTPIIKQKYLDQTHEFYEKHGAKTIIIARFVPIVRTFAPFVAGIGTMNYKTFISYNIIGGMVWVTSLTLAGFFFGQLPIVKDNFETVIFAIIGISLLPILFEFIKMRFKKPNG